MNSHQTPHPTTQRAEQHASGDIDFMPEEDDFEPNLLECQLTDKFIEALAFGDGPLAASALFELKGLDCEVPGVDLETLASLFEDGQDYLFPSRLQFVKRRRGKPKHQPSSDDLSTPEKKLIDALKRGNPADTGAALRGMKQLRGDALELMALLLEDSAKLGPSFPCRLLFRRARRGRPYHPLRSGVNSFGRYVAVQRAKAGLIAAKKPPRMKSAVGLAGEQTGCSRSTLFMAVKRHRPSR